MWILRFEIFQPNLNNSLHWHLCDSLNENNAWNIWLWRNSSRKQSNVRQFPNQAWKKNHPEKNSYIFLKKSHTKQTSYTSLKNAMNQPRAISSPSFKILTLKKSRPKQTSYIFLKNSMDQPRLDIIKNVLHSDSPYYFLHSRNFSIFFYTHPRRFLYRSQPYWRFFSFSFSKKFLYLSWTY